MCHDRQPVLPPEIILYVSTLPQVPAQTCCSCDAIAGLQLCQCSSTSPRMGAASHTGASKEVQELRGKDTTARARFQ